MGEKKKYAALKAEASNVEGGPAIKLEVIVMINKIKIILDNNSE